MQLAKTLSKHHIDSKVNLSLLFHVFVKFHHALVLKCVQIDLNSPEIHGLLDDIVIISDTIFLHVNWSMEDKCAFHLPHRVYYFFASLVPVIDLVLKVLFLL